MSRQRASLNFATQHTMLALDGKRETECLNTRFHIPTLLWIQRDAIKKLLNYDDNKN